MKPPLPTLACADWLCAHGQAEHVPFLQACWDDALSDVPRLVYADWLDEHGELERAEFIRLSCALARGYDGTEVPSVPCSQLAQRVRILQATHGPTWWKDIPDDAQPYLEFERGLLGAILASIDSHPRQQTLFQYAPLYKSVIATMEQWQFLRQGHLSRLRDCSLIALDSSLFNEELNINLPLLLPYLQKLRIGHIPEHQKNTLANIVSQSWEYLLEACLFDTKFTTTDLEILIRQPWSQQLIQLDLTMNQLDDAAIDLLCQDQILPRLRHLSLSRNQISSAGVYKLLSSKLGEQLETLDLSNNRLSLDLVSTLEKKSWKRLRLEKCIHSSPANPNSTSFSSLPLPPHGEQTHLNFCGNELNPLEWAELGASKLFHAFQSIQIGDNLATTEDYQRCFGGQTTRHLQQLIINSHEQPLTALPAMLRADLHAQPLRSLTLNVPLTPADYATLATIDWPLQELSIHSIPLTANHLGHLVSAPWTRTLRRLSLYDCSLKRKAVQALLSGAIWENLSEIDLSSNPALPTQTVIDLVTSPKLPALRGLNLANNDHIESVSMLATHPALARLEWLDLTDCGLGSESLTYLASRPRLANVVILNGQDGLPAHLHRVRPMPPASGGLIAD
jgi:uncharacterized protein (TIGR02996 family)